jgi:AcrR family transcriptional regulator
MKTKTRKEQQAETRSRLMQSAARLFCRRGLERASVDEVARDAGYTKGAFYANFRSKEELFLAMMDEKFAAEIDRLDEALRSGEDIDEQARHAGEDFIRFASEDGEWPRLFFEFAAYAARNDQFREEFMARYRAMRERVTTLYKRRVAELGVEPPIDDGVEKVAVMTTCMANGFLMEQLLEPDLSEELYGTMMEIFFRGLGAMLEDDDPEAYNRVTQAERGS